VSNQSSVLGDKNGRHTEAQVQEKSAEVQRKVDVIVQALGVPVDFMCALEGHGRGDLFRKPMTGQCAFGLPSPPSPCPARLIALRCA
jgi:hypothetical protein